MHGTAFSLNQAQIATDPKMTYSCYFLTAVLNYRPYSDSQIEVIMDALY